MADPHRPLSEGKIAALKLLKQAFDDAEDAGADPRQFAPSKDELLISGAATSDLLWLVTMRYAEHVLEITRDASAIRQFQAATNPGLRANSCLILTYAGKVFATENGIDGARARQSLASYSARSSRQRVRWDKQRHELFVDGILAKRFKHDARAQWRALDFFEDDGWKGPVEMPPSSESSRDPGQRLRELIADLNASLNTPLIHFRKDPSGMRITFDLP